MKTGTQTGTQQTQQQPQQQTQQQSQQQTQQQSPPPPTGSVIEEVELEGRNIFRFLLYWE